MLKLIPLAAALATLAACAAQPAYHPIEDGVGFTEERVSGKVYRVSFQGDKALSQKAVEDMLLLRMAELTQMSEMDHFTVVIDETVCDTEVKTSPTSVCKYEHSMNENLPFMMFTETLLSDEGRVSKSYKARAMFIMGHGVVTSDTPGSYVAEDVVSELGCLKEPGGCPAPS